MDFKNFGLTMPTLAVKENNIVFTILQVMIFVAVFVVVMYVISLYFKNVELKSDSKKNQEEIEKNLAKIEQIKKWFVKIGGIVLAVIIMSMIILSNFIEL